MVMDGGDGGAGADDADADADDDDDEDDADDAADAADDDDEDEAQRCFYQHLGLRPIYTSGGLSLYTIVRVHGQVHFVLCGPNWVCLEIGYTQVLPNCMVDYHDNTLW